MSITHLILLVFVFLFDPFLITILFCFNNVNYFLSFGYSSIFCGQFSGNLILYLLIKVVDIF